MRDSDRAAFGNLFLEQRQDGTRRTQHVTKADNCEARSGRARSKPLDAEFGKPLGRTHDVRWTYRFIR